MRLTVQHKLLPTPQQAEALRRTLETAYKAALKGVPVHYVDPRNTSRTCPNCGHCAKENRGTQSSFACTSCGFEGLSASLSR